MDELILPLALTTLMTYTADVKAVDHVKWDDYQTSAAIVLNKKNLSTVCSGVFLSPTVVLTTAHCLVDLVSASVTNDKLLNGESEKIEVLKWVIHPSYDGNKVGESLDVGLLFLKKPISNQMIFPKVASYDPTAPFKRIGFGLRYGSNRRTLVTSNFDNMAGMYVRVQDQYGYPGDSGGPVYQEIDQELKLVGLHTGREVSPNGYFFNISYIQPIHLNHVESWISEQTQTY